MKLHGTNWYAYQPQGVKHVRTALHMTQRQLGTLLGVHHMTVYKWEHAKLPCALYYGQLLYAFYVATLIDSNIGEIAKALDALYMSPVEPLTALLMTAARAVNK